ncbi:MAG TPA: DUF2306 domain-containing protein, partial [Lacipirellulaceae bacterium]|nr:DUF2306 domain-containing protein [Lacipirellulaceae bacterium]
MEKLRAARLLRMLRLLACVLILKVTLSVVLGYRDYFPPNFASDFLRGREAYFFGAYQWAFYLHIASGPISLLLGLLLFSEQFRTRYRKWHRLLGKIQVIIVLLILVPSGLWMARYAETGTVAAAGFSMLSVATGVCVVLGWRMAVQKRFTEHRRWMSRCFLMLCSAVVLRLFGGLVTVIGVQATGSYPLAAWASWLVPLAVFELSCMTMARVAPTSILDDRHSSTSARTSASVIEISSRRLSAGTSSARNSTL